MAYRILGWILNGVFISLAYVPFWKYGKFLGLDKRALRALERGDIDRAENLANELLSLAEIFPKDWNYNNAIHKGHTIIGSVLLLRGDLEGAGRELIESGDVEGSPQLSTFGPNMSLARELLRKNQKDTVLIYLDKCKRFWEMGHEHIDYWYAQIQNNQIPDFGPNLYY